MLDIEDKLYNALHPGTRDMLSSGGISYRMSTGGDVLFCDAEIAAEIERVADELVAEGWEAVGSGCYSLVLKHPDMPGKVLKLVITDDASPLWVEYCAARQGQPFVPVIHSYGEVLGFPFAVMDELVEDPNRAAFFVDMADEVMYARHHGNYTRDSFEYPEFADLVADAYDMGDLDIHNGNIMFHPDTGEAFLTDPIT